MEDTGKIEQEERGNNPGDDLGEGRDQEEEEMNLEREDFASERLELPVDLPVEANVNEAKAEEGLDKVVSNEETVAVKLDQGEPEGVEIKKKGKESTKKQRKKKEVIKKHNLRHKNWKYKFRDLVNCKKWTEQEYKLIRNEFDCDGYKNCLSKAQKHFGVDKKAAEISNCGKNRACKKTVNEAYKDRAAKAKCLASMANFDNKLRDNVRRNN